MTSTSSFGVSQITLQFDLDRDIDAADAGRAGRDQRRAPDCCRRTCRIRRPTQDQSGRRADSDAALTSETMPLPRMTTRRHDPGAEALARSPASGASDHRRPEAGGARAGRSARAGGLGIGLEEVRTALAGANVNRPKGTLDGPHQAYTIATNDQLAAAAAYKPIIIAYRNGAPVRLSDVADVVDGVENDAAGAWVRTHAARSSSEHPAAARHQHHRASSTGSRLLPQLQASMPQGVDLRSSATGPRPCARRCTTCEFTLILTIGPRRRS